MKCVLHPVISPIIDRYLLDKRQQVAQQIADFDDFFEVNEQLSHARYRHAREDYRSGR